MKLGQFIKDKEGNFHGSIKAFGMPETTIILAPQTSQDGKPYYEVVGDPVTGGFDGGAAFPKQKGDLEYLSVSLDSPIFPTPVHAGLFQDRTKPTFYNLVWDRFVPKAGLTAEAAAQQADAAAPPKANFSRRMPGLTPQQ